MGAVELAKGNFQFAPVLKALLRGATQKRLASAISKKEIISVGEVENKDDFIYGQWMSLILLSGPALQVTLKTHYFNRDAVKLVSWALGKDPRKVTPNMVMDFMREFLNLAAGEIKAVLAASKVPVGLSLPLITRGFDEVLFSDVLSERNIQDWWNLTGSYGLLTCTSETEIFQPDALNQIKLIEVDIKREEDEGDVDFL